jgi:hypothetical protein
VKKKKRVEQVTRALIGFRPGQRVRVVRPRDSWLSGSTEGLIVTLGNPMLDDMEDKRHPKNRWSLEDHVWWLAECSMELL